jgi:hypothetical protein
MLLYFIIDTEAQKARLFASKKFLIISMNRAGDTDKVLTRQVLAFQRNIILECTDIVRDKHSSLFCGNISRKEKSFIKLTPG